MSYGVFDAHQNIFVVCRSLKQLFKVCGEEYNFVPRQPKIYRISGIVSSKEQEKAYQRWSKENGLRR